MKRLFAVGASLAVAAALPGLARADEPQTPVETACPAGFELLSVAQLEATGPYLLPRRVDTAGNNDGYVCGLERPDGVRDAFCEQGGGNSCLLRDLGLPIYLFEDNDSPASR